MERLIREMGNVTGESVLLGPWGMCKGHGRGDAADDQAKMICCESMREAAVK